MEKKGIKVVKEDIQAAEFEWIKVGHKLPSVGARGAHTGGLWGLSPT